MRVGFIGLGNVGAKLAGSLLRNGADLIVRDLDKSAAQPLLDAGAAWGESPATMTEQVDLMITCLPSPAISAAVVEGDDGILSSLKPGQMWAEMSTTDEAEIRRLGAKVLAAGGEPIDCPVSGGCHRADTGNIAIFAGCERSTFERALPVLTTMGRRILHTGELGSASMLKVMTNYLATANLVTLAEALVTSKMAGMDLGTTYEAIRISSGNSFVHETESQVILNGSRDINFTMDLVSKDIGIFQSIAERHGVPLEVSPLLNEIFNDGRERYGDRELSPNIIRRLEDAVGTEILAPGFPAEMTDDEPEAPGYEVVPASRLSLNCSAHEKLCSPGEHNFSLAELGDDLGGEEFVGREPFFSGRTQREVGDDDFVETLLGELADLVDDVCGRSSDRTFAGVTRLDLGNFFGVFGQEEHGLHRGVQRRGVNADLFTRSGVGLESTSSHLGGSPGVPLVGMPGSDAAHTRPTGTDQQWQFCLDGFGVTRCIGEGVEVAVEVGVGIIKQ